MICNWHNYSSNDAHTKTVSHLISAYMRHLIGCLFTKTNYRQRMSKTRQGFSKDCILIISVEDKNYFFLQQMYGSGRDIFSKRI